MATPGTRASASAAAHRRMRVFIILCLLTTLAGTLAYQTGSPGGTVRAANQSAVEQASPVNTDEPASTDEPSAEPSTAEPTTTGPSTTQPVATTGDEAAPGDAHASLPLTLDGQPHDITVAADHAVQVETSSDGSLHTFYAADCSGASVDLHQATWSARFSDLPTISFKAVSPADPTSTSACLNATWIDATATETPTTAPSSTPTPPATVVVNAAATSSLTTGAASPSLTLNGNTSSIVVSATAIVRATTDSSATIYQWPFATCTGPGYNTRLSTFEIGASAPGVNAFQAVAKDDPTSRSACLTITWANLTPTPVDAPPLTLNGGTSSITVSSNAIVKVATSANASITLWTGNGCNGPGANTGLSTLDVGSSSPGTNYFRASLKADPSVQSACLSITWALPTPTPTVTPTVTNTPTPTATPPDNYPPLTLNGGTVSLVVPAQAIVTVLTDPKATLMFWGMADCAGGSVNLHSHKEYAWVGGEASWSYRAAWLDNPSLQSPCLTITFTDGSPTPTPTQTPIIYPSLTMNGAPVSIVAPPNAIVHILTDPNASLTWWEGTTNCMGTGFPLHSNESFLQVEYQTVLWYQASLNSDPSIRSACLSVTSSDIAPTPTRVVGETPPASPDTGTCETPEAETVFTGAAADPCLTPTEPTSAGTIVATSTAPASAPGGQAAAPEQRTPAVVSGLPNTGSGAPTDGSGGSWAFLVMVASLTVLVAIPGVRRARRR